MKTLSQILSAKKSHISELLAISNELRRLDEMLHVFMDDKALARHCHLAKLDLEKKKIFLTVDNSSWATKLHYAIPDILKSINVQTEFKSVKSIQYSIIPPDVNFNSKYKSRGRVSKKSLSQRNELLWNETLQALRERISERKKSQR
jgi:hypothetical protein